MGISTATSRSSTPSGGMPDCSWPRTVTVRCRAAGRSASRTASSASSTPTTHDPDARWRASHPVTSRLVQCTQARRRSVFPRPSASGTHGNRGTARQAPTASQVRSKVPRFAPCIGHSGAAIRWFQHSCGRLRRWRAISARDRTRTGEPLTGRGRAPRLQRQIDRSLKRCFAAHPRPSQTADRSKSSREQSQGAARDPVQVSGTSSAAPACPLP